MSAGDFKLRIHPQPVGALPMPAKFAPTKSAPTFAFSICLDIVRFTAAMIVFLEHAKLSQLIPALPWAPALATAAVAAFFVLSGYVIASTTDRREGWRRYAVLRSARLYSVVLPAWLLSIVLKLGYAAYLGRAEGAEFMQGDMEWWHPWVIATFLGESWTLHVPIPWNGPIWSLDFEAFYYLFFGIFIFARGRARPLGIALALLVAGPKIVLLFPCWAMGAALAWRQDLAFTSRNVARAIAIVCPILLWGVAASGLENYVKYSILWPILPGYWRLHDAQNFVIYYLDSCIVALGFIATRQLTQTSPRIFTQIGPPVRWAAGYTFSLYMFHRPLQNLAEAILQGRPVSWPVGALLLSVILLLIVVLGNMTEKRKVLWQRLMTRIIGFLPLKQPVSPAAAIDPVRR